MKWKHIVAMLICSSAPIFAQSSAGVAAISGAVRDSSGAAVPNVKVVISSAARGQVRSIETNEAGVFTAPALLPGTGYQVTITAAGFQQYQVNNIDLRVGQNLNLNADLTVASGSQQIEVTAVAPLIDDTKQDVSNVVNQHAIENLPINGRRVDSFVLLTPGVTNDGTFGLLSFRGVAGNNSFLLDGNDNTEQFYDENAGRTRIASQISLDAVQEFQVVSADYSAEYGRAMGGVVNTVTKSGSNAVHGTAFYYFRSTGFDARDPYATFAPSEHRVQAGGNVGGAIVKDKLFYFFNADITRRNFPMVDSQVKAGIIDPIAHTWLGCGATAAQCSAINGLLPRFFGSVPRTADNDLYFGRLDYHLNERNTFSADFNFLRWKSPNGIQTGLVSTVGSAITGNGDDSVRVRDGKFTWTSIPSSSAVNEFRFGWTTDRQADTFDQAELGNGLGYLGVSVAGVALGPASYLPRVEPSEQRFEFADSATWTAGSHTIKFGADIAHNEEYVYYINNYYGTYSYPSVTAFAQDYTGNVTGAKNWSSYSQVFGNPVVDGNIVEYAFFLQDQWRVTPKLSVTLGARYEHSAVQQPPVTNPDWPQTGRIPTGRLNLMPRLGFAYRLTGKTVIRGGFGTYYARFLGSLLDNLWTNNGKYQISDSLNNSNPAQLTAGPVFPNSLAAPPTGASVGASTIQFASPNLKTPYSEQGSLAVERELVHNMVLTVSGIWSHGVDLYGVTDVNAPTPSGTYTYTIANASGSPVSAFTTPIYTSPRPNTKYGSVYQVTNGVSSYYDGLAVSFEKRFSHGLQMQAAYTWSHEIDDGQSNGSGALFFSSASNWTYNGNYGFDKGSGLLDQRHRFVYSFVYEPTFTHRDGAFYRYVVNNWQLSAITTLASGLPTGSVSIRVSDSTLPFSGALSNSTINGLGASSRVPFWPVNSLYTPASYRADARLSKVLPLGGEGTARKLYLNLEAFNISNSWSPTSLTTQAYTESKGVLTLTPAAYNVGTQDGGFPDGTQARRLQISARFEF